MGSGHDDFQTSFPGESLNLGLVAVLLMAQGYGSGVQDADQKLPLLPLPPCRVADLKRGDGGHVHAGGRQFHVVGLSAVSFKRVAAHGGEALAPVSVPFSGKKGLMFPIAYPVSFHGFRHFQSVFRTALD